MTKPIVKSPEERIVEVKELIAHRGAVRIDELAREFPEVRRFVEFVRSSERGIVR